jgi:energy-coupling factor transport system permease protein
MIKDITLGQFFPGNSIVHRLDPRTKILLTILYIVALFCAKNYVSYAFMLLVLITCVRLSTIRVKSLVRGIKPLIIIIVFTAILNMFFTNGTPVADVWLIRRITWEGLRTALFMVLRIMMLVSGTFLLTYTTSPMALTDGLEQLLNPLKKLKAPVHELSMMMSIALRFIPTLIEETDKIMSAQKARGADFDSGGLARKAKALLPLLIPLFVSAFRRADELATAMESRCYHGGEGRTRLKQLHLVRRDYMALLLGLLVIACVILLARFGV